MLLAVLCLAFAWNASACPVSAGVRFFHDPLQMDQSPPRELKGPTPVALRPLPENDGKRDEKEKEETVSPKAPAKASKTQNLDNQWAHDPDAPPGYTPPPIVKRLFSNPTRANAEAYVDWLMDENKKARKVTRLVQEATLKRLMEHERQAQRKAFKKGPGRFLILAFLRADCPHCREQALVLDSLNERGSWKGKVSVRAYLNAASPKEAREFIRRAAPETYDILPDQGRSKSLGIAVWPTMFILPPGVGIHKAARIKGMSDHRRLTSILDRLSGKKGKNAP